MKHSIYFLTLFILGTGRVSEKEQLSMPAAHYYKYIKPKIDTDKSFDWMDKKTFNELEFQAAGLEQDMKTINQMDNNEQTK